LAIPVLLILAVLWAAVLVPPVLRSRTESRRGGIGDLHSRLGTLTRRPARPRSTVSRDSRVPLRPVPPLTAPTRSRGAGGRSAPGQRAVRGTGGLSSQAMTPAQKRRRNVLVILIGGAILSLGLAVLVSPMLWIAQGIADVLLVGYLYLLVLHRRGSLASTVDDDFWGSRPASPPRPVALAHPRAPARPELAPLPGASRPRRSATG
jgi:hypothetical protein